jgi:hypothetical protein
VTRRRRALLLLGLALALGGLAATDVSRRQRALEAQIGPLTEVVVARHQLAAGDAIALEDLGLRRLPGPLRTTGGGNVRGRARRPPARGPGATGGAVTPDLLAQAPSTPAQTIAKGERALELLATGSAPAGSRVDVVVTSDRRAGTAGTARLALENVEVLAAAGSEPRTARPRVAATLRVTPAQAVYLTCRPELRERHSPARPRSRRPPQGRCARRRRRPLKGSLASRQRPGVSDTTENSGAIYSAHHAALCAYFAAASAAATLRTSAAETFVVAWRKLPRQIEHPLPWLYASRARCSANHRRKDGSPRRRDHRRQARRQPPRATLRTAVRSSPRRRVRAAQRARPRGDPPGRLGRPLARRRRRAARCGAPAFAVRLSRARRRLQGLLEDDFAPSIEGIRHA